MKINADLCLTNTNELIKKWSSQFDSAPSAFMSFTVDGNGILYLNGTALCYVSEIDFNNASYDVEFIYLPLQDRSFIEIGISWPFEGQAEVFYISKTKVLYISR